MALAAAISAMTAVRSLQTVVSLGARPSASRRRRVTKREYDPIPDCDDPDLPPFVIASPEPPFDQSV